jgi:dihydroorotate dehydrogenase electron transfer subunit
MIKVHHLQAEVVQCLPVASRTYRLRLACPPLARSCRPGQFVMLRLPRLTDPLLGRAFALYDTDGTWLDLVFLVVGKLTGLMADLRAGDRVELWGPLGNGFPSYEGVEHLVLVAGGIGQTPFLALARRVLGVQGYAGAPARREVSRVTMYYGVRTAELFAGLSDFASNGMEVRLATDDGSLGFAGRVTDLLSHDLTQGLVAGRLHLVGCGPEPMLQALATLARRCGLPCDLSLETPMACGLGICFGCVTRVRTPSGWDYRRTCVDGPVFAASQLVWDQDEHNGAIG